MVLLLLCILEFFYSKKFTFCLIQFDFLVCIRSFLCSNCGFLVHFPILLNINSQIFIAKHFFQLIPVAWNTDCSISSTLLQNYHHPFASSDFVILWQSPVIYFTNPLYGEFRLQIPYLHFDINKGYGCDINSLYLPHVLSFCLYQCYTFFCLDCKLVECGDISFQSMTTMACMRARWEVLGLAHVKFGTSGFYNYYQNIELVLHLNI